jgi:hypothetical protein
MALKTTSSPIQIGFSLEESGANTFTEGRVDLQLNPLDQEVFVVQAIDLDPNEPEAVASTNTDVEVSVSSTSLAIQARPGNLSQSQVLATSRHSIRSANATSAVSFDTGFGDTPASNLEYIGILATNDFFIQIKGGNNAAAKSVYGKLYGYRARADAATYAALVQSEVLSS